MPLPSHAVGSGERNHPAGKPENPCCQTALDRGVPFDSEPLGAAELLQEKGACGEGVTCVRASGKILYLGW